jgi:hypothetical protein
MRKLLLIVLLWTLEAAAQQSPDPLVRSVEAHGGGALSAVQSLRLRAQSDTGSKPQPVTISSSMDGKLRIDYGQPVHRTDISTAEGTLAVRGGNPTWSTHAGAYAQLDLLSVFGILHLAQGIEKTSLPPATVSGREADRIRVATGRGKTVYRRPLKDEAEVSVDKATGLVSAISRTQYADESLDLAFTLTTTFSDYRAEAGFLFPFKISRYVNGVLREIFTVESIEINPAFAPETFGR